jgi:hypothetical protein
MKNSAALGFEERRAIKLLVDKATRANFPGNHANYNDGWCYNCNEPIDLEQSSKYCNPRCAKKNRDRVEGGYPKTKGTKL